MRCILTHRPEVVIVDEIGTEAEALACRSIAERGVQLVGTAHGQLLENLIKVHPSAACVSCVEYDVQNVNCDLLGRV